MVSTDVIGREVILDVLEHREVQVPLAYRNLMLIFGSFVLLLSPGSVMGE